MFNPRQTNEAMEYSYRRILIAILKRNSGYVELTEEDLMEIDYSVDIQQISSDHSVIVKLSGGEE